MEKGLKDLLIDELHDIYNSEHQIVAALPEMVTAASSPDLKNAFSSHLKETKEQIKRLEKIFKLLKISKKEKFCEATKGLVLECKGVLKEYKTKSPLRDAALISKAQRIEHYEISAYGTARTFAKETNLGEVADLLQETLDEEGKANKILTRLAEGGLFRSGINNQAYVPEGTPSNSEKKKAITPEKTIFSKLASPSLLFGNKKVASPKKSSAKKTVSPKKPAVKQPVIKKAVVKKAVVKKAVVKKAASPTKAIVKKVTTPSKAKKSHSKAK